MPGWLLSVLSSIIFLLLFDWPVRRLRGWLSRRGAGFLHGRNVAALVQATNGRSERADSQLLVVVVAILLMLSAAMWMNKISELRFQTAVLEKSSVAAHDVASQEAHDVPVGELIRQGKLLVQGGELIYWLLSAIATFLGAYLTSFVAIRRIYSHELRRFSTCIRSVATGKEIVALALVEYDVHNEDTLRTFVSQARLLAGKYGVERLTRTFEIWPQAPKR